MTLWEKIGCIRNEAGKSYWAERIATELEYLTRLSALKGGRFDRDISMAADGLLSSLKADGVITDDAARFAEKVLLPLSPECKKYRVICVGHAHIDMNWMWGFQETAGLAVDTLRTMLDLMDEYPGFTFAQSQASVYRIVEEYAPWMMEQIKERIRQGRWEVTASTWVETDKNMPSGESLTRHILMTRDYMSRVWGVDPDSLDLDYEPDTFGHSLNVPEICAEGGVKYYYHCRGFDGACLYRWQGPSGAELICCREPLWYNGRIEPLTVLAAPEFCETHGIDTMLKVYGVGDHGGGPTRRDIEKLIDMASWPLSAELDFGTFREFFRVLEKNREKLPVFTGEKNFVFTGCYTSQSRIKMANRIGEARLGDAEFLNAGSALLAGKDFGRGLDKAWERVLFNHFHDILPGSGKVETREYAMGEFQKAMAAVNTASVGAMNAMAEKMDLSLLPDDGTLLSVSEGAGVGFGKGQEGGFALQGASRGRGKNRAFVLFNPVNCPRRTPVELTVWDWQSPTDEIAVLDHSGREVPFRIAEEGRWYWDHSYVRIEAELDVPALGWTSCWVTERKKPMNSFGPAWFMTSDRVDRISDENIVLDNGVLRAEFDRRTAMLVSLKKNGAELLGAPACGFDYIEEDTVNGMTSWRVGNRSLCQCLNENYPVRVEQRVCSDLKSSFRYTLSFMSSRLEVTVSLAKGSEVLEFGVNADWHQVGGRTVPSLVFSLPYAYASGKTVCDVPMGAIMRDTAAHDVPCLSFCAAENPADPENTLLLTADTKYGFRNDGKCLSVSLVRASTEPDPYPEYGEHRMRLGVGVCSGDVGELMSAAESFCRPVTSVSVRPHGGELPCRGSVARVEGAALSAVKTGENGKGTAVRIYNPRELPVTASVGINGGAEEVWLCDSLERPVSRLEPVGEAVSVELAPMGIATLLFLK